MIRYAVSEQMQKVYKVEFYNEQNEFIHIATRVFYCRHELNRFLEELKTKGGAIYVCKDGNTTVKES